MRALVANAQQILDTLARLRTARDDGNEATIELATKRLDWLLDQVPREP